MHSDKPTEAELSDIALCAQKLWDLDDNRLANIHEYDINVGKGKKMYDGHDAAPGALFALVTKGIWSKHRTYKLFYDLLDNYRLGEGTEVEHPEEKAEINTFLEALMHTRPMRYCHAYLSSKGLVPSDELGFKKALHQMWFSFYKRAGGLQDSCGFEHVFVGEADASKKEVSGFHNWITFWLKEAKGEIDYQGYLKPRNRGEVVDDNDRVLSIQFDMRVDGEWQRKPVTTLFIGTSPEFEMALYTLYFVAGAESNQVLVNGYQMSIKCYRIRSRYGDKIGTCFPELLAEVKQDH